MAPVVRDGAVSTTPAHHMTWKPGPVTYCLLTLSILVSLWVLSWSNLGADSRTFYAVARVDAAGANPYDPVRALQEERKIESEAGSASGRASGYPEILYGYPPILTRAWRLLVPAGDLGFFWVNALLLLGAGLAGLEMLLAAMAWRGR